MKPKLNKDQTQKILLSLVGFIALVYCYFSFFLGPLNKSRASTAKSIAEVQAKTTSSNAEMKQTAKLEI